MKNSSCFQWMFTAAALVLTVATSSLALAADFSPQTNREGGVEVTVTPRVLSAAAPAWEFDVTFSTHTVALTGDPSKMATLVDTKGRSHAALAWQGDPPGGHHRKGILKFKPLTDQSAVDLRIEGVGATTVRRFRWQIR